jgi:hypothetical protein
MTSVTDTYETPGGSLVEITHTDATDDEDIPHDRAYECTLTGPGGRELLYATNKGGVSYRCHASVSGTVTLYSNPRQSWQEHLAQFLERVEKLDPSVP